MSIFTAPKRSCAPKQSTTTLCFCTASTPMTIIGTTPQPQRTFAFPPHVQVYVRACSSFSTPASLESGEPEASVHIPALPPTPYMVNMMLKRVMLCPRRSPLRRQDRHLRGRLSESFFRVPSACALPTFSCVSRADKAHRTSRASLLSPQK